MSAPLSPEFFADPRLLADERSRDGGGIRLAVLNGTGLPLALIVVSAELRYQPDDELPFETLGPVTLETWEPPFFPAGISTFEFEMTYSVELAAIINDIQITYIVLGSEYAGPMDEDLLAGDSPEEGTA